MSAELAEIIALKSTPILRVPTSVRLTPDIASPTTFTNMLTGIARTDPSTGSEGSLTTVVAHTGSGVLQFVMFGTASGAATGCACKITIDGTVILDDTVVGNQSAAANYRCPVGGFMGAWDAANTRWFWVNQTLDAIPYRTSLLIERRSLATAAHFSAVKYRRVTG